MRRKLGYCLLTGTLLLSAAALIGPTIVSLDTDVTYGNGEELVYKISKEGTTYNGVATEDYINDNTDAVDAVATEMEGRLKTWGVEADVIKEGYDTVRVKIRADSNDDTEYQYLENYLAFSGGSITVGGSEDSLSEYQDIIDDSWDTMFEGNTARIEYVKVSTGEVPAVVIPVNEGGTEGKFNTLLKFCTDHTKEADSSAGTSAENCYLVLWANKQEGDTFDKANSNNTDDYDANVAKRLIFAEVASQAWFDEDDDDDDYTEFQLIPSSAALSSEGFDNSKAGAAYKAAFYYMNMLNASSYGDVGIGYDVNFAYSKAISASSENLISSGAWNVHPAFGATAIACLVALCFFSAILIAIYKIGALAILSNMAVALMGSLLLFSYFNAQFGIGALVGCLLVCLVTAFGGMYYFSKFKEQLYQGRSTKKAHQEAAKRAIWPTVDASIIGIIIGLCVYGFISSVVGKAGLILVLGSFFGGISNLLILRLEGYFLSADADVEKNAAKVYNVSPKNVPDLAKDEKPSYFGAFQKTDFSKHSKPIGIVMSVIALASLIGISVFIGTTGNAYNFASDYSDTTVSQIEYRSETTSILPINTTADLRTKVIDHIYEGDTDTKVAYTDVTLEEGSVYMSDDTKTWNVHYYTINWTNYYPVEKNDYNFIVKEGDSTFNFTNLQDALVFATGEVVDSALVDVKVNNVVGEVGQPSMGSVWLGLGIGALLATLYMVFRYRLSRGLATGILATGSGLIVMGFFSLTRIATTPIASIAGIATTVLIFIVSLFILGKERELHKDSREKDKDSLLFRSLCLTTASSQAAEDVMIYAFLSAFAFIWFMGFMPGAWKSIFLGCLVGLVILTIVVLTLLTPLSLSLAQGFSKININFHPKKKELAAGKRGSEPEEAIFIGIND